MPICTVDRKLFGRLASSRATWAEADPSWLRCSSRILREETTAISDIANSPFRKINIRMIKISKNAGFIFTFSLQKVDRS